LLTSTARGPWRDSARFISNVEPDGRCARNFGGNPFCSRLVDVGDDDLEPSPAEFLGNGSANAARRA
jgi:hypothetical protein